MTIPLKPLNLSDWTGGLNLRADAFQLQANESPEMLNVDIDPRGGVRSRRGWVRYNATAITAATWNPGRLHIWEQTSGSRFVMLGVNGGVQQAAAGAFSVLNDGAGAIVASATGHGVDFADWGSLLYMACGRSVQARKWTGSGNATALTSNGASWQNDYTAPVGGFFPAAEFATVYQGYMVCAYTKESAVDYPNRVRFSHPNSPENWALNDYIDINAGGARITGIVAFSDHVVVFKTNSVWAIYGNDATSFTPVNITNAVGAIHRNAITMSESVAYFYSHPNGVHAYIPGQGVKEVSPQLRPIIDSGQLGAAYLSKVFLGYLNRRLWFSAPYEPDVSATEARSVFVYDPSMDAWTRYTDTSGDALGPYATGGNQGDGALLLAAHRTKKYVLAVEANDTALDTVDTVGQGFATIYATGWQHAGWPSLRKSWRRPDLVVTELPSVYTLTCQVRTDYDEGNSKAQWGVVVTNSAGDFWGVGVWDPARIWGGPPKGADIAKGGAIGLAKSVQLRFSGEVGKPFGLNAVVMKFRPRKFK